MTHRIGIEINTETTGGAGVKQQIQDLRELHNISAQFESLRNEAAQKYPEDLKRQNNYIREQINLQQRLETAGSRERISDMRHEMEKTMSTHERNMVKQRISAEQRAHVLTSRETVESQAARMQWAEDMGIGDPADRARGGFADDFLQSGASGFRGGGMGMLSSGLGRFGRTAAAKFAGMGVGAKLAAGTGIGLAAVGALGAAQFVGQGIEKNRQLAPEFTGLMSGMSEIPEGTESMKIFRREVELSGLAIGKGVQETIQLEREWMRLGGTAELAGSKMERTVLTGFAHGIDAQAAMQFTGAMARTGYQPGEMNEDMLSRAIMRADAAGMGGFRRQEFMGTVQGITPGILRSAVTADPEDVIAIAAQFAEMGLPFQGERGTEMINRLQGGITQSGGLGFEAARRVLEARGEVATPASIQAQQELGLTDYENMKELWGMFKRMGGGKEQEAAFLMGRQFNIPMRALWNPDEDMNSLGEMLNRGASDYDRLSPEEITKRKKEMDERVDDITDTTGFMAMRNKVITEIGKIETAANLFGDGVQAFNDTVTNFGEKWVKGGMVMTTAIETENYKATVDRQKAGWGAHALPGGGLNLGGMY